MSLKKAFITGITGQDGAILAQILLEKNYHVVGMRPYLPVDDTMRLSPVLDDVELVYGEMADTGCLAQLLSFHRPDEIYNLAAMSHVQVSFSMPEQAGNINGLGVVRLMDAMRIAGLAQSARLYQASSSEMFGNAPAPQNESTPFAPCSPYGAAKAYAFWMVRTYREAYGMHASNGILFNHESPLRGEHFVTRKITRAIGELMAGRTQPLLLGNLEARRDWGHAHDYMRGAWMMMQQDAPDDYVLATGQTHSVRDFVEAAFKIAGRTVVWRGQGVHETGYDRVTGQILVAVDPALFRPVEIHCLCGDAAKAKDRLGWRPLYGFEELVADMVAADMPALAAPRRAYA